MGKYNSINDAVRAKIDKLVEEKGLDKKDYLYTADVASSLNQLASIMGGSGDSMTIADSLYDVLDSADGASSGGSGGDFAALVDGTITQAHDSTVTSIRPSAFWSCSMLSDIDFPNAEVIGLTAFMNCSLITDANFPNCLSIESMAFSGCTALSSISFPVCEAIQGYAFAGDVNITVASFPKCKIMDYNAFFGDTNLSVVSFPDCMSIGSTAFGNCNNLSVVSFPNCITICSGAFQPCFTLLSAYFLGSSVPSLERSDVFNGTPIAGYTDYTSGVEGNIFVRASLVSSFKTASNWSYYSNQIVGLTDEEIAELDASN